MEKDVKHGAEEHNRETLKNTAVLPVDERPAVELLQPQSKALNDLKMEEEALKIQVKKLEKENFSLEASIRAWEVTYEQKQRELTEAESKLNEVYKEIWSERDKFCARAEKFHNQYGILSKWWEERMNETFNPTERKSDKKHQEKVDKFENEIDNLQKKIEDLGNEYKPSQNFYMDVEPQQADIYFLNRKETEEETSSEPGNRSKTASPTEENKIIKEPPSSFNESPGTMQIYEEICEKLESWERQMTREASDSVSEIIEETPKKKRVRFSEEGDRITIFNENQETLKMKLFSIVDIETVRRANRLKNRRNNKNLSQKHTVSLNNYVGE